jgi:hypothetical protein
VVSDVSTLAEKFLHADTAASAGSPVAVSQWRRERIHDLGPRLGQQFLSGPRQYGRRAVIRRHCQRIAYPVAEPSFHGRGQGGYDEDLFTLHDRTGKEVFLMLRNTQAELVKAAGWWQCWSGKTGSASGRCRQGCAMTRKAQTLADTYSIAHFGSSKPRKKETRRVHKNARPICCIP